MKKTNLQGKRIDCVLVWGHGEKYINDILNDIRDNENFEVLKIQKHKPKNIRTFVKEMYYAPFWHLKAKTKYLLKTKHEVCFIFIKNFYPEEEFLDSGKFRHKESMTLKRFKELLRDKYNPYENGIRTHNHVIHATDSEAQTEHMLKYLGYKEGLDLFTPEHQHLNIPYYLRGFKKFIYKQINTEDLCCKIITGISWEKYSVELVNIKESPQYLGLTKDMKQYENYINKYLGGALQEYYNLDRYEKLYKNFEYLKKPYENSFVLVEKIDETYIILDGVHRACSHLNNKNTTIKICQLLK